MPQAKPTQVIVHRIELQQSERAQLKEYLETRKNIDISNTVSKYVGPLAIGGALVGSVWIGAKVWANIQAALLGPIEDAKNYIEGLYAPKDTSIGGRDYVGDISEVRENLSESGDIFTETVRNPTVRDWVLTPTISRFVDAVTSDDSKTGKLNTAFDRAVEDFFDGVFGNTRDTNRQSGAPSRSDDPSSRGDGDFAGAAGNI